MPVDLRSHRLQFERKPAIQQQPDSPHASVVAPRHLRERFVSLFGPPVEGDFDLEWWELAQVVGDLFVDQDSVGEQGDQESFLLCEGVNFQKIFARENLAAG